MKNWFKNKLSGMTGKQLFALFILAAADVFVIAAPYYIKNVVPNLHQYLGIREDQVSQLTSIIGWVTLVSQLPGGFLANKFSSRWLLFLSVISTGILTVWFGFTILSVDNYASNDSALFVQYAIIWGLWGITSTLIFWTPLWKLVSQQTNKENQGFAYGLQGAANGVIGLIFIFALALIITQVWIPATIVEDSKGNIVEKSQVPFATYAFIIAGMLIITSFFVLFCVPEKKRTKEERPKASWENVKRAIKSVIKSLANWRLWMLSIFVMGMYTFQSVFAYYLVQMLKNVYIAPAILVLILGGIRTYGLRMLVSPFVGRLADKFRSYILLLIIVTGIGLVIVSILTIMPLMVGENVANNNALIAISSILFFLTGILSWFMVTLRYTQVGEIHIEKNTYASSIAVLSFIGFSTDAWLYEITTVIGKSYTIGTSTNTSTTGYMLILLVTIIIAFIGLMCGLIVFLYNRREIKRLGKTSYRWRELANG